MMEKWTSIGIFAVFLPASIRAGFPLAATLGPDCRSVSPHHLRASQGSRPSFVARLVREPCVAYNVVILHSFGFFSRCSYRYQGVD